MHTLTTAQYFHGYLMEQEEDVPISKSEGNGLNREIKKTLQSTTYRSACAKPLSQDVSIGQRDIKLTTSHPLTDIEMRIATLEAESKKDFRDPFKLLEMIDSIFNDFKDINNEQWGQLTEVNIKACWESQDSKRSYDLINQFEAKGLFLSRDIMVIKIKIMEELGLFDEVEQHYGLLCKHYSQQKRQEVINWNAFSNFYATSMSVENQKKAINIYDDLEKKYPDGRMYRYLKLARAVCFMEIGGVENLAKASTIFDKLRSEFSELSNDDQARDKDVEVRFAKFCLLKGDLESLYTALENLELAKITETNKATRDGRRWMCKNVDQMIAKIYCRLSTPKLLEEAEKIYLSLKERFEKAKRPHLCRNHKTMLGLADVYIKLEKWSDFDNLNLIERRMVDAKSQTQLCIAARYFEECISPYSERVHTSRKLIKAIQHAHESIKISMVLNAEALSLLAFCAEIAACNPEMLISSNEFILCREVTHKLFSNEFVIAKSIIKKLAVEILIGDIMSWKDGDRLTPEYLNNFALVFSLYADIIDPDYMHRPRMSIWNIRVQLLKDALSKVTSKYTLW